MPAIWLALTTVLGNLVRSRIGFWIGAALTAWGVQAVSQNFVVEPALASIQQQIGGLGSVVVAWFAYLQVDKVITITLSAYAAAAAFSSLRLIKKPTA